MNWFTKLFEAAEKPDWRLCANIDNKYITQLTPRSPDYKVNDPNNNCTDHTYTYYLYENQFGERKFDVIDTQHGDLKVDKLPSDSFVFRNKKFREKIRSWLDGRYDPDIPDYETIPKNDFQNRLAKKKIK